MRTPSFDGDAADVYLLRVGGHLDPRWSEWFDGLALEWDDDGTTRLSGAVADQAQLHGLLSRIRDLGLTLISATRVPTGERDRTG
jgi:hypothetical protein